MIIADSLTHDSKNDLEEYLRSLASTNVITLEEIIEYNLQHKEKELPSCQHSLIFVCNHAYFSTDFPIQNIMENALKMANSLSQQEREDAIHWMRQAGGPNGIDKCLQRYNIDVIIGPADCECTEPPAAAGKNQNPWMYITIHLNSPRDIPSLQCHCQR